jgi:glyoxylate/hydroxypyruvate reductase A
MAQQMAHYVIYGVLRFQRRFEAYQQLQDARRWAPIEDIEPIEQFPVGVMGLGAIGSIVARQLAVIGFPVLGWSAGHKVIDNIRTFDGETGLSAFLSESRVVVNLLPLTDKTEGLINKKFFSRMSAESFLINIGRGQHICEDDVLEALEEGLIAGAMLDVFEAEPLPSKSPLWNHPKVIITPHVSGLTVPQAALDQIIGNIKRIENGHALDSVVDRIKGY